MARLLKCAMKFRRLSRVTPKYFKFSRTKIWSEPTHKNVRRELHDRDRPWNHVVFVLLDDILRPRRVMVLLTAATTTSISFKILVHDLPPVMRRVSFA